jgi:CRP-like cAMP-binding protein
MENLNYILTLDINAKTKHLKKREIIQKAGEKTSLAYYVKKGLLKSYTIDEKGKEHIFMFASEGWIITDIESQEFNQPTELYIDCIEESEIIVFDRQCFKLAKLTENQLRENTHLLERRIAVLQKRVLMLMSASAQERYNMFLETHSKILNRVPQRLIASYLGITPEALSKIRGAMAKVK